MLRKTHSRRVAPHNECFVPLSNLLLRIWFRWVQLREAPRFHRRRRNFCNHSLLTPPYFLPLYDRRWDHCFTSLFFSNGSCTSSIQPDFWMDKKDARKHISDNVNMRLIYAPLCDASCLHCHLLNIKKGNEGNLYIESERFLLRVKNHVLCTLRRLRPAGDKVNEPISSDVSSPKSGLIACSKAKRCLSRLKRYAFLLRPVS